MQHRFIYGHQSKQFLSSNNPMKHSSTNIVKLDKYIIQVDLRTLYVLMQTVKFQSTIQVTQSTTHKMLHNPSQLLLEIVKCSMGLYGTVVMHYNVLVVFCVVQSGGLL